MHVRYEYKNLLFTEKTVMMKAGNNKEWKKEVEDSPYQYGTSLMTVCLHQCIIVTKSIRRSSLVTKHTTFQSQVDGG